MLEQRPAPPARWTPLPSFHLAVGVFSQHMVLPQPLCRLSPCRRTSSSTPDEVLRYPNPTIKKQSISTSINPCCCRTSSSTQTCFPPAPK